jgi:flavin reductase (DIM6/NTAB) family NADH-FMN oxidoreductase RutF
MIAEEQFRIVMGHFATGVTVVASRDGAGKPVGLTVNAFTSVSLHPPLVLVCLHRDADARVPLIESGHFGVSVLTDQQADLAVHFSQTDPGIRFRDLELVDGPDGSPLIPGALAWLQCKVDQVYPGGDHVIVVGEVTACGLGEGEHALFFFRGALGSVAP